jgi:uncharacterized protein YeaO (DUF488 family)
MTKTFYTSNYETNGSNPKAVAISNEYDIPASYDGVWDEDLSPTSEMLTEYHDRQISHDEYAAQYAALLTSRGLTPESIADKYEDGTIFICYDYEDGDISICHRFILSEILNGAEVATVSEI